MKSKNELTGHYWQISDLSQAIQSPPKVSEHLTQFAPSLYSPI